MRKRRAGLEHRLTLGRMRREHARMTDQQADAWFESHAHFEIREQLGITSFQLWRKGKTGPKHETVGFVVPTVGVPHPDTKEAQRFLAKWFVKTYGE